MNLNLNLRGKLILAFLGVLVLPLANSSWGLWSSTQVSQRAHLASESLFPALEATSFVPTRLVAMREKFEEAAIFEDVSLLDEGSAIHEQIKEDFGKALEVNPTPKLEALITTMNAWGTTLRANAQAVISGESVDGGGTEERAKEILEAVVAYRDRLTEQFAGELSAVEASAENSRMVTIISLSFALIVGLGAGIAVSSSISRRVTYVSASLQDIAKGEGDLTVRLDETGNDEFSELSHWFNVFVEQLQATMIEITSVASDLNSGQHSAEVLSRIAAGVSKGSADLKERSADVATNSSEMASEISSVSTAIEESSSNVRQVASAIDTMSTNLTTISKNSTSVANSMAEIDTGVSRVRVSMVEVGEKSAAAVKIAREAAQSAREADSAVNVLGQSANDIGKIIGVINDIAEQTNLLALNATIEAASAGEAGRGFAVVAGEVKELAKQTASATDEIRSKVEEIQRDTELSASAIGSIVNVVEQVGELSKTMADLAENQRSEFTGLAETIGAAASSAKEMNTIVSETSDGATLVAQNAVELATGTDEVSSVVAHTSVRVKAISSDMDQFASHADQSSDAAGELKDASEAIQRQAERLAEATSRFRL